MYHKRGLGTLKAKHGGVFARQDKKLTADVPVVKALKFYHASN
jgi:hypothetical protein